VLPLEGINDIGSGSAGLGQPLTAQALVTGYRTLINEGKKAGVAVHGGTLLPFQGVGFYQERDPEQVNQWIRTSEAFDSVIDFERAVRDPFNLLRFLPAFDCGDHLHRSEAGYAAMGYAVNLKTLPDTAEPTAGPGRPAARFSRASGVRWGTGTHRLGAPQGAGSGFHGAGRPSRHHQHGKCYVSC
jgi:hypothetical protein